ncbi:hypothetical protein Trydic_g8364 [Trypoxylus dichotomus]
MYSKSNPREPLSSHAIPERPWQKIGMDVKALDLEFLVIVDYYSKFTVVNRLNSKTPGSVISTLKKVFSMNGLPSQIFSDNGPPFNSKEFHIFTKEYGIKVVTSSPYYPRSNGMVERTIQTVKGLLTKSFQDRQDPFLAILNYNTTPKQNRSAPFTLLIGRRLRTTLPINESLLKPTFPTKGDDIRSWKPGVVVNQTGANDYNVKIEEAEYRRNRQQIRPAHLPTRELSQEQEQSSHEEKIQTSNEFKNDLEPTTDICSRVQSENSETNPRSVTTRSGRVVNKITAIM